MKKLMTKLCGKSLLFYEEIQFLEKQLRRLDGHNFSEDAYKRLQKQITLAKRIVRSGDDDSAEKLLGAIKDDIAAAYDRCKVVR